MKGRFLLFLLVSSIAALSIHQARASAFAFDASVFQGRFGNDDCCRWSEFNFGPEAEGLYPALCAGEIPVSAQDLENIFAGDPLLRTQELVPKYNPEEAEAGEQACAAAIETINTGAKRKPDDHDEAEYADYAAHAKRAREAAGSPSDSASAADTVRAVTPQRKSRQRGGRKGSHYARNTVLGIVCCNDDEEIEIYPPQHVVQQLKDKNLEDIFQSKELISYLLFIRHGGRTQDVAVQKAVKSLHRKRLTILADDERRADFNELLTLTQGALLTATNKPLYTLRSRILHKLNIPLPGSRK